MLASVEAQGPSQLDSVPLYIVFLSLIFPSLALEKCLELTDKCSFSPHKES